MKSLPLYFICIFLGIISISDSKSASLGLTQEITQKQQNDSIPHTNKYFVIVGVYGMHTPYGNMFAENLTKKGFQAKIEKLNQKDFRYVYTFHTNSRGQAIKEMRNFRKKPEFSDAWVLKVNPEEYMAAKSKKDNLLNEGDKNHKQTQEPNKETIGLKQPADQPKEADKITKTTDTDLPIAAEEKQENNTEVLAQTTQPEIEKEKQKELILFLNTINAQPYKEISGKVKVIEGEKSKFHGELPSQEFIHWKVPKDCEEVLLVCDIFGYKRLDHDLNLRNPFSEESQTYVQTMGDTVIVNFELARHKKGDIIVLYNVFFYKDAAVMQPKSKFELSNLLEMLQENENIRIKIHGHTNGNAAGKIIGLKDDDINFFEVGSHNTTSFGTAKALSLQRAKTIKRYLVYNGIDPSRMEVIGWGGKKMLFDKHHPEAKKNVRVEIEILEN
jgi:outer membrane protein OmpA-like peptidoglycan-associated protein